MIDFKQLILPGDVGSDVLAVKHTLRRMAIKGNEAITMNNTAGPAFVATLRNAQAQGDITVDGKYGRNTHALIAPHFTPDDEAMYQRAAIRRPVPELASGDAAANARQLLQFQAQGKYQADNAGDLKDIQATAAGRAVRSQSGQMVHIDARVMQVLVHLIDSGHTLGTFAICSDHHDDGPHGHAGGRAVDISTIDGHSVATPSARAAVIQVDKQLHNAGALVPRQLITGGVGNKIDQTIEGLTIPSAAFYGPETMQEHTNHIHVGYSTARWIVQPPRRREIHKTPSILAAEGRHTNPADETLPRSSRGVRISAGQLGARACAACFAWPTGPAIAASPGPGWRQARIRMRAGRASRPLPRPGLDSRPAAADGSRPSLPGGGWAPVPRAGATRS